MIPLLLAAALALTDLRDSPPPAATVAASQQKLAWAETSLTGTLAQAKSQNKLAMAYFYSTVSAACDRMNNDTFGSDRVAERLKDVLCVRIDYDKQRDIADRYAVKNPPVVVWFNADGTARERMNGLQTADVFLSNVARIKADIGTINEVRKKIAANGSDLDARFELYRRLKDVGDAHGAEDQKAAIQKLDPDGKSRGSHRFRYEQITKEIESYWDQNRALDMKKVADLQSFVEAETDPEIVWDGWMRLSNTHEYLASQALAQGKADEAAQERSIRRQYLSYAWRGVPEERDVLHEWIFGYGQLLWEQKDELSQADKEFMVTVTARGAQVFDGEALAHDLHARALFISGMRNEAIAEVVKALAIEPGNTLYQERLKDFGGK